ncbi:conserved Plasmodium protein, unknown function [Plasmodium gallinaceum]|uniref:RIIa domain-containing protein n=1 Tax=Plasmodium gallinaceum TaxID=5849 RepID=A0A1J1GWS4_PLAGA|nr:conserved Plasmodium protein, unknown function [Plasmodium gallinaceum]CRG95757.1 conserved Plasmodium protein, unknown function [Plasmodium gallinaceum]
MQRLNSLENNSRNFYEDTSKNILKNDTDKNINILPSLNENTFSSFNFEKIGENDYFLTNNLNDSVYDKPENIVFKKDFDREKFEKKKIFLFNLSEEQKEEAKNLKINKILQNEMYLKKNKVLKYIIQIFLSDILKEKPDNIYEYTADYFTQPNLKQYILQKLKQMLNKS